MNKTELIDAMAADAGISKAAAKKALESFLGSVSVNFEKRRTCISSWIWIMVCF